MGVTTPTRPTRDYRDTSRVGPVYVKVDEPEKSVLLGLRLLLRDAMRLVVPTPSQPRCRPAATLAFQRGDMCAWEGRMRLLSLYVILLIYVQY